MLLWFYHYNQGWKFKILTINNNICISLTANSCTLDLFQVSNTNTKRSKRNSVGIQSFPKQTSEIYYWNFKKYVKYTLYTATLPYYYLSILCTTLSKRSLFPKSKYAEFCTWSNPKNSPSTTINLQISFAQENRFPSKAKLF